MNLRKASSAIVFAVIVAGLSYTWAAGGRVFASPAAQAAAQPAAPAPQPRAGGQAPQPRPAASAPQTQRPAADQSNMAENVFKNIQVLKGIPVDEFLNTMG